MALARYIGDRCYVVGGAIRAFEIDCSCGASIVLYLPAHGKRALLSNHGALGTQVLCRHCDVYLSITSVRLS